MRNDCYERKSIKCVKLYKGRLYNIKTSMMWPSQNFLLYNGTVIKIQVNESINN